MAFKFPFTNYHELNLTWVLEQLKKLFEDSEENVETIEGYEDRLSAVEDELPVVEATADQAAQTANAAATLAQTAKRTADTANENALAASAQAGLARQEAAAAEAEAQAATQAAQQAQATVQNFDGRITQAEDDASEALQEAQSFENRVNAAINTANNAANTATIAQGIAVNANQNAAQALDELNAQREELEAIGAEQIDNITDEADAQKQDIQDLADSVIASIPSDYTQLSEDVENKAPLIVAEASGAVASFADGADDMQIRELVCNIEPVQAGTGDPSPTNIRLISGHTGMNVARTGVNVWNEEWEVGGYADASGLPWNTQDRIRSKVDSFIPVLPVTRYFFKCPVSSDVYFYDRNKNYISHVSRGINSVVLTPIDCYFMRFATYASYGTVYHNDISLNYPESDTAYHDGKDNVSIFITFPTTIYGGSGEVIQGDLASKMEEYTITGNENLYYDATNKYVEILDKTFDANAWETNILCSHFKPLGNASVNRVQLNGTKRIRIYYPSIIDSIQSAQDYFIAQYNANTPVQVCVPILTPIEYTLTPHNLSALYGQNNIWTDVGAIQSCKYPADTKLYIDGKIAELQALILEN